MIFYIFSNCKFTTFFKKNKHKNMSAEKKRRKNLLYG